MKATGFVANVMVALLLSVLGAALFAVIGTWLAAWLTLMMVFAVLAGGYLAWMLYGHRSRGGISLVLLSWLVTGALLMVLGGGTLLALLTYTGLLWITRSLLRYRKPGSQSLGKSVLALMDASISLLAVILSIWVAQHTHSFGLACWAYFFTQSLVFFLPGSVVADTPGLHQTDRFTQARRNAELALEHLQSNRV